MSICGLISVRLILVDGLRLGPVGDCLVPGQLSRATCNFTQVPEDDLQGLSNKLKRTV